MPWATNYDPNHETIEVVYTGIVSAVEITEAASKRINLQKETGALRIIINTSDVAEVKSGIISVLDLPSKVYKDNEVSRLTRIVILPPTQKKAMEIVKFFETACVNRGWTAKIFERRQDAIDWLIDKSSSY